MNQRSPTRSVINSHFFISYKWFGSSFILLESKMSGTAEISISSFSSESLELIVLPESIIKPDDYEAHNHKIKESPNFKF